jgi:type II secretory pathway component PulF
VFALGFGFAVAPAFAEVYSTFYADLSDLAPLTRFIVFDAPILVWVLLLLGLAAQLWLLIVLVVRKAFAAHRLTLIVSVSNLAGQLVVIYGLYTSIFVFGTVVDK